MSRPVGPGPVLSNRSEHGEAQHNKSAFVPGDDLDRNRRLYRYGEDYFNIIKDLLEDLL